MATKLLAGLVVLLTCVILVLLRRSSEEGQGVGSLAAGEPALSSHAEPNRSLDAPLSGAARVPVELVVQDEPGARNESPEEQEPTTPAGLLDGIVDFYLGDGVMERMVVIDQRLMELTGLAFAEQWERGVVYRVQDMGPNPYEDERGRPRPCQVRREGGGVASMVILPEEKYPEAWILMQAKKDLTQEIDKLKQRANRPWGQAR